MDKLIYLLPALGCAAMMAVMMWMMRGGHDKTTSLPTGETQDEIARLRAEVALLRQEQEHHHQRDTNQAGNTP